MLERVRGLSPAQIDEIAALESRVVAADGGRLKLEYGTLRSRSGDRVDDLLHRADDGTLVGFAGIYAFGGATPEIAGMVDPAARRHGIGAGLLQAALAECRDRDVPSALLVVPRGSDGGHALARSAGGEPDHSEHALVLPGEPTDGPEDPSLQLRRAAAGDAGEVTRLLSAGFDWVPPDVAGMLARDEPGGRERTMLAERDGTAVATLRITLEDDLGGVYGFTVDPALQGRGIGRLVLRRSCRLLRDEGATRVGLEVAVENEGALGLYTSVGFEPVTTEDYYRLLTG